MKQKKNFSIGKKLIILLVVLILFPTMLIGFTSYRTASTITENQIRAAAGETITGVQEHLGTFLQIQEENITVLSQNANIKNIFAKKPEEMIYVIDVLKGFKEGHKDILNVYIGLKDKKMHLYPKTQLPTGFDPTTRPWYQDAASQNKVSWSEPYIDTGTEKLVVTVSIPVYNDSKEFVGVLGADISLEQLTEFIGKSKIGSDGYIILLDKKGITIAHPDKNLLGKELPVPELVKAANSTQKGSKDYIYNTRKCAYFSTLDNTGWKILGVFEYHEISDTTNSILVSTALSALVIVILAILVGVFVSRPMTKSIKVLSVDMLKIGNGDFTARSFVKSRDEIGFLADTVNNMVEELSSLMRRIKSTATEVSTSADSLAAASEETTASTSEISRAVTEIACSTQDQAHNTADGLEKASELAQNIQGISDTIRKISEMVTYSNGLNQKGLNIMGELLEKTKANEEASNHVSEVISEVDKSSGQIGEILGTISSIASQTNLLALNASIEAARAGEQGRGFAVVAEEIRKLAEQSAGAANNIQKLIKEIQSISQNAVTTIRGVKPIVEAQNNAVAASQEIFTGISETILKLMGEVSGITELNNQMIINKNEILSAMENISASAEENSASTQQVSASTQEQLAGMEEVARTAEQLNMLAHNLSTEIEKFKV